MVSPALRNEACTYFSAVGRQCVFDAIVHMGAQRLDRRSRGVALQRGLEQRLVLGGRLAAAVAERNHLVAEIFVEHQGMRLHQHARAAIGDQRLMEFAIVALPLRELAETGLHQPLG